MSRFGSALALGLVLCTVAAPGQSAPPSAKTAKSASAPAAKEALALRVGGASYALRTREESEGGKQVFVFAAPAKRAPAAPYDIEVTMSAPKSSRDVADHMLGGVMGLADNGGRVIEVYQAGDKGPGGSKVYVLRGDMGAEHPEYVIALWRYQEGRVFKTVFHYPYKGAKALAALEKRSAAKTQVDLLLGMVLPSVTALGSAVVSQ